MTDRKDDDLDALALMKSRFRDAEEGETINRVSFLECVTFYHGSQWLPDILAARRADGRPAFTYNRLPAIVRQVLNDVRTNPPSIEIEPEGGGADDEHAEVVQGLTRHVETHSSAKLAYEHAFEYMVIGGFASWRIDHDYLPQSFDQELFIEPIWNPLSVYWDPASKKPDKSDARYCFVTIDLSVDAHNAAYPDSELVGRSDFEGLGDQAPGWMTKDGCRVVEYFTIEDEDATLVKLEDGSVVYDNEIPDDARVAVDENGEPIERKAKRRSAYVAHSNGVEWLRAKKKLATDDIPIVTIYGDRLLVDGELRIKGMVEDLMEPQRAFNYNSSAIAETMALGTKANWLATAEQIEPFQAIWAQANSRNFAVLPYRNVPGVNPPSKIATEPPIQAMSAARQQSADDLRSISGVYDGTQSPKGGEESGKAIIARRHQAAQGNNNYTGNLARGIKRTADILLKMFPVFYDSGRLMRIVGRDQQKKNVMVHAGRPESLPAQLPEDIKGVFDLKVGTYSVTVSVGKSYDTMNEETLDMMLSLVGAEPALAPVLADLIVNLMAFPGKSAFVERLQRALPPNLQDPDKATDPIQLQAQNGQLMEANKRLMGQVQQLAQMIKNQTIQTQGRKEIEAMKAASARIVQESKLEETRMKTRSAILIKKADAEFTIAHDHALADKRHVHDVMYEEHAAKLRPVKTPGLTQ